MRVKISDAVTTFHETDGQKEWNARYPAILFRSCLYVATPRHMDAINLAFTGMTQLTKRNVCNRIADGKEKLLFGSAKGDGTEWEWNEEFQNARMSMYGFD